MGLDQWLYAKNYLDGGYDWVRKEDPAKGEAFDAVVAAAGLERADVEGSGVTVQFRVCTWRKANQIHSWFITHCWGPDREDNCVEIPVTRDQLRELREDCEVALELFHAGKLDDAALKLPPMQGFFFGDYEIDEWWASDVKFTAEKLTEILANPRLADWEFAYEVWY